MAVRIGLAFNLKPEAPANPAGATSESPPSDEPPSRAFRPDLHQPDLYAEWDEPATIDAVERALSSVGQVHRLEADSSFPARLSLLRPDFVFNIAEGLYGASREAHVPAICEFLGVPYHASDPLTLGLALHKGRTKEILSYRGVPTAAFTLAHSAADARRVKLPFPLFVKPAYEGSGKGISTRSLCRNRSELVQQVSHLLATYSEPVLIETYLPGQEFTVAILGNGDEARCLPIIGMRFDMLPSGAPPIYGYEASGSGIHRAIRSRSTSARPTFPRGSRRKYERPRWEPITLWNAATGAASTSAVTLPVARWLSSSIPCRAFCPTRGTIPVFPRPRLRPE